MGTESSGEGGSMQEQGTGNSRPVGQSRASRARIRPPSSLTSGYVRQRMATRHMNHGAGPLLVNYSHDRRITLTRGVLHSQAAPPRWTWGMNASSI